jgi:hypothetical protein
MHLSVVLKANTVFTTELFDSFSMYTSDTWKNRISTPGYNFRNRHANHNLSIDFLNVAMLSS